MATVNYTTTDALLDQQTFTWTPLTETNADGQPAAFMGSGDRTVQVSGTFGGGTIILEGSIDGGANYFPLKDAGGTAISFTAAGGRSVLENCTLVRPRVTAGTGVSLTATLMVRKG